MNLTILTTRTNSRGDSRVYTASARSLDEAARAADAEMARGADSAIVVDDDGDEHYVALRVRS